MHDDVLSNKDGNFTIVNIFIMTTNWYKMKSVFLTLGYIVYSKSKTANSQGEPFPSVQYEQWLQIVSSFSFIWNPSNLNLHVYIVTYGGVTLLQFLNGTHAYGTHAFSKEYTVVTAM